MKRARGFRVRTLMLLPIVIGLSLVLLNYVMAAFWVGSADIPLDLLVVDALTQRPIDNAAIALETDGSLNQVRTTSDGYARTRIHATIGGKASLFYRTRSVNYGSWWLTVSSPGHERHASLLNQHTDDPRFHTGEKPPPIIIRLRPTHVDSSLKPTDSTR